MCAYPQAKENTVTAITQLAYKSRVNQDACATAGGLPLIVQMLTTAANQVKEVSAQVLCSAAALAIWRLSEDNVTNQTAIAKAGAITPLVSVLGSPVPEMQSNAAVRALNSANKQLVVAECGLLSSAPCATGRDFGTCT